MSNAAIERAAAYRPSIAAQENQFQKFRLITAFIENQRAQMAAIFKPFMQ
jgi:hypothetical protein